MSFDFGKYQQLERLADWSDQLRAYKDVDKIIEVAAAAISVRDHHIELLQKQLSREKRKK